VKKHITSFIENKKTDRFIIVLLILNIIVFNCGVENHCAGCIVAIFDYFSMLIFTMEYILRVSIVKKPKEIFRPMLLMDLIALLPYYLAFLPFKLNFLRLITGCGDFYPAAGLGRIIDAVSLLICAGVHWIIVDLVAPAFVKLMKKLKPQPVVA
jgi:hypothetical protein